jgi:hypothetical protein
MVVHESTNAGMRGSQGTASLRSTIPAEEVWWFGVPYPTPENLNWCTFPATLKPLDTCRYMLPSMNLCREGFQHDNARPHTARSTVDFLTNQNVTVLPWPSKSPDMNPIEQLWYDFERHMRSRQPVLQTLQTYNRLLSKNGENSARPYSSIARVYIETGRYCVTG